MQNNGNKKDQKNIPERDNKGRFVKGCSGGPGRGRRSDNNVFEEDLLELVEKAARGGLNAKDIKDRLKAASIGLQIHRTKPEDDKSKNIYNPEVLELLKLRNLVPQLGGIEGIRKILQVCPGCEKFPGKSFTFNMQLPKEGGGGRADKGR